MPSVGPDIDRSQTPPGPIYIWENIHPFYSHQFLVPSHSIEFWQPPPYIELSLSQSCGDWNRIEIFGQGRSSRAQVPTSITPYSIVSHACSGEFLLGKDAIGIDIESLPSRLYRW